MRTSYHKFNGTGVAVVTPFKESGIIDFGSFEKIIQHLIAGGVDYIVLLGTTGESATIHEDEKHALMEFSVRIINGRVPLVVGFGGNFTDEVIRSVQKAPMKGVDAILSVCPYYTRPQQDGIYQHFKKISEASPVPVILYTVPGRTSSNITAGTTIRLAKDCPNIIGIKEASGSFEQIYQVIKNKPVDFLVISGDDGIALPLIAAGAAGLISVTANAYPKEVSDLVRSAMDADFETARRLHYKLIDFTNALFTDGSPSGIKAALAMMNLCDNYVRLPLVPVNQQAWQQIKNCIDNTGG